MLERKTLLSVARGTKELIDQANTPEEIKLVKALASAVADFNYEIELHPDLAIELIEYANFKDSDIRGQLRTTGSTNDPLQEQKDSLTAILDSIKF